MSNFKIPLMLFQTLSFIPLVHLSADMLNHSLELTSGCWRCPPGDVHPPESAENPTFTAPSSIPPNHPSLSKLLTESNPPHLKTQNFHFPSYYPNKSYFSILQLPNHTPKNPEKPHLQGPKSYLQSSKAKTQKYGVR